MTKYSRKEFLGMSALLAGGVGYAGLSRTEAQERSPNDVGQADLVVINARVATKRCASLTRGATCGGRGHGRRGRGRRLRESGELDRVCISPSKQASGRVSRRW
jgi:hypothetical protein